MNLCTRIILLIVLLFMGMEGSAQTSAELKAKKDKLKKEIEYKNSLLKQTKESKNISVTELYLLKKKISNRQELINTIENEIDLFENQIADNKTIIVTLEEDVVRLKEEYGKMIRHARKNSNSYSRIMFIFASESFNQAYKRIKYFQQYAMFREKQAERIRETQTHLEETIAQLEIQKSQKEELLAFEMEQKQTLNTERREQQSVVNELYDKEKDLKKELKKKQREARKLRKAIERIIKEEIRKAKELAKKKQITPEAKALSASFAKNRGKLPWPVYKGVIVETYGEHAHPVLKGIKTKNNGIDIATEKGGKARTVFAGEVTRIMIIKGVGKVVMIRHGDYLTIYSNLEETYVKAGDKVKVKQDIGTVIHDESKGKTVVHFELWQGMKSNDPQPWLYLAK